MLGLLMSALLESRRRSIEDRSIYKMTVRFGFDWRFEWVL